MKYSPTHLSPIWRAVCRGTKQPIAAAEAAGYRGKFIETNANRLLRHPRVKERIAELVAPAQQAREHATIATVEMARQKLSEIILASISLDAVKAG